MKITKYEITTKKLDTELRIACVSDVHGRRVPGAISALKAIDPDVILLAGDILEISVDYMKQRNETSLNFLEQISAIAPTYYCFGNHEIYFSHAKRGQSKVSDPELLKRNIKRINSLGIHIVNDSVEPFGDKIAIGGVVCGYDKDPSDRRDAPSVSTIEMLENSNKFKILLCHYPHYYHKHLKNSKLDLIVSGHAHGGQWRLFGRGIYAPHQGIFPRYTSGIYDGRFIINRGAANNARPIPRLFNPCEVLDIHVIPKK